MVDYEHGKAAITEYEILEIKDGKTLIALYPKTGRTHQLRVHCAHEDGLGTPIVGDELYGEKAERLYLDAEEIEFVHPITGRKMYLNTCTNQVKLCENEKDI
jgi:tRNA pseudouridine32 synthase/23S rRNA pseudouridine746 synthase